MYHWILVAFSAESTVVILPFEAPEPNGDFQEADILPPFINPFPVAIGKMSVTSVFQLFYSILTTIPLFAIPAFMTWPSAGICGWDRQVTGIVKDERGPIANAVPMMVTVKRVRKAIKISVTIVNDLTGHHVPTDSPLRHMILLVRVKGDGGQLLDILDGPKLPKWCGVGDVSKGYYAGLPGKVFAKVLEEKWTRIVPTAAYWNPTRVVQDNRLAAFAQDTSTYSFSADISGSVTVDVSLLYRRAYKKLMDLKGWTVPDIVMERQLLTMDRLD